MIRFLSIGVILIAIVFHNELITHFEAYVLLHQLVNQKTPTFLRAQLCEAGLNHEASMLLDDIIRIYEQAKEYLMPLSPQLSMLFLSHHEGVLPTSGADLLTYPYLPDHLHVLAERFDALTVQQRQGQLLQRLQAVISEGDTLPPKDIPSLVSMLEISALDSFLKYQILLLCHHAVEAANLLQMALNRALWPITRLVRLFGDEAAELMHTLSALPDFVGYIHEKTGLQLAGKGDIHVYPSALLLDVSHIEYKAGARAPSISLFWGVRFNALSLLNAKAMILSENLGAALHVISEKTKLKILLTLRKRPYYGAELAELLGLKPATISHHMNELLRHEMVTTELKQNKLYYAINATRVREALKETMALLEPW